MIKTIFKFSIPWFAVGLAVVCWFSFGSTATDTGSNPEKQAISTTPLSSSAIDIVHVSSMSTADIELARLQEYCPVTFLKFLNMKVGGIRVDVEGRDVLVANSWAREKLLASPQEYLKVLDLWNEERSLSERVSEAFSGLSEESQVLAKEQRLCLVDNTLLGVEGEPVRMVIQSFRIGLRDLIEPRTETIFVCCDKCKIKVLEMPEKYFDLLDRNRVLAGARLNLSPLQVVEIEKSFADLPPEDRKLAEEQVICPVTKVRLGTMGMGEPIRVKLDDHDVMICCEACRKNLVHDPKKYYLILDDYHQGKTEKPKPSEDVDPPSVDIPNIPQLELPEMKLPQMS